MQQRDWKKKFKLKKIGLCSPFVYKLLASSTPLNIVNLLKMMHDIIIICQTVWSHSQSIQIQITPFLSRLSPVPVSIRQKLLTPVFVQVSGTDHGNFTITRSRRKLRLRLPESVTLTAEGNCCWEVFRQPFYKVQGENIRRKS